MVKLNEIHVQQQLGHKNLPALTNKRDKNYKKYGSELNGSKKNSQIEILFIKT